MEAVLTMVIGSIVLMIISFKVYCLGGKYKRIGVDMFRGLIGANIFYWLLVLVIGLAPMH